MPTTDDENLSSPSSFTHFGRSLLSLCRDHQVHSMESSTTPHVHSVATCFLSHESLSFSIPSFAATRAFRLMNDDDDDDDDMN